MPLVFRAACGECEYQSADIPPGGYAVLVPDPDGPPLLAADHPPVLHPFAPFVLDEFGLTFATAAWGGQLVERSSMACRDCGRVFERRRLTAGGAALGCGGCGVIAGLAVALGAVAAFASGNPFVGGGVGAVAGVLLAAGVEMGASAIVRGRYPDRARAVDTPRTCPGCHGNRVARVGSGSGPFPCPACGRRAVRFTAVARP